MLSAHTEMFGVEPSYPALKAFTIFKREGVEVELLGLNESSETIIDRFGIHDNPEALERVLGGH